MKRYSLATLLGTGLLLLSASAMAQEIPSKSYPDSRDFAPVQRGFDATGRSVATHLPNQIQIKFTPQAARDLQYADAAKTLAAIPSGLASFDRAAQRAGMSDIRRSHPFVKNRGMAEQIGVDRWFTLTVAAGDMHEVAKNLQSDPHVQAASPVYVAFPAVAPNDPSYSLQWGHDNTGQMLDYCWQCGGHDSGSPVGTVGFDANAEAAWDEPQGYGSSSVVIAILDSGVDNDHPDLNQVAGYDYGDNDTNADDNSSQPGHGTACAGVAAATANNGLGVAGVAGGCSIMPLKVADSAGTLAFTYIQNGLYHAADNGADIASMSFGAAITSDPATDDALLYAYNNGVTLLAATGNENASSISYPANQSLVIGVGAASPCGERKRSSSLSSELNPGVSADPNGYTCDNERWWGSNYGSTTQDANGAVDIIAPTIQPTTDIGAGGGYTPTDYNNWFNGTSCSTPYAAGVCALILSANPTFTPAQIRDQLVTTAQDVTSVESGAGWDRYTGYGMVDAAAAVNGGGPPPPPPTQDYATLPYSTGFESGLDTYWSTQTSNAFGRVQTTSANGPQSGSQHLTMDVTTNGNFSEQQARLHLDLSGQTQVSLDFWWKEFGDETHAQDGVYFSDNGGATFTKVQDLNGGSTTNNTWQQFNLDLDALAGSNGLSLTNEFVVKFQQYDNYAIATDGFAFDGIDVSAGGPPPPPPPGDYATLPYSTGFESGSLDQYWAATQGVEGRILVTSANGPRGSYHVTMDDAVSGGSYSENNLDLSLDLTGETEVDLSFYWKEFGDEDHAQDGVYFSDDDGASFTKVANLTGGTATYQQIALDLDALAASNGLSLSSTFIVRVTQYDNYPITSDGFGIDDVSVSAGSGPPPPPPPGNFATLPYSTGFEGGNLDQYWDSSGDNDGRVLVTTANTPHGGSYHVTMDDAVSGGSFSTNNLDLHLDLSGESQVSLDFWWKEFGDETHSQDGVYFSDDDGASFAKVHDLNGGSVTNSTWNQVSLDLDVLAAGNGVSLTGTFVVRITQYDNYPIASDGFGIDDVSVAASGGGPTYITAESEDNGSSGVADGPVGTGVNVSGTLSSSGDDDWYYFDVTASGNVNISLSIGSSADLDWFLYNASLTEVARGYTTSNPEAGSYSASPGRYYLFVDGYQGATSSYTLSVTGGLASASAGEPKQPKVFAVPANFPNPFNPSTAIRFDLPQAGKVRVDIYDLRGRRVRTLTNGHFPAGSHAEVWNGTDDRGGSVASGQYVYRVVTEHGTRTRKMMLLK